MSRFYRSSFAALAALVAVGAQAQTVVSYAVHGSTYSQNFDTLAATGSPSWANNSPFQTLTGWSIYRANSSGVSGVRDSTLNNATAYTADNGSSATGAIYSYGASGTTERALGDVGSGSTGDVLFVFALKNDTPYTLTQFTLGWSLEQWRNGGQSSGSPALGTQHSLIFDYKINATGGVTANDTTASYVTGYTTPGGAFNGTGPVGTTAAAAAIDGNSTGKQSGRGGTITGLTWAPGATLVMRLWDDNNTGNDHGLAIDDVSFRAVPEPSTYLALGLGVVGLIARRRRK